MAAGTADGGAYNSEATPSFPSRRRVEGSVPRTDPRGSTGLGVGPRPQRTNAMPRQSQKLRQCISHKATKARRRCLASALIPTPPSSPRHAELVSASYFQRRNSKILKQVQDDEKWQATPRFPSRRRVEGSVPRTDPRGSTGLGVGPTHSARTQRPAKARSCANVSRTKPPRHEEGPARLVIPTPPAPLHMPCRQGRVRLLWAWGQMLGKATNFDRVMLDPATK